MLSLSGCPGRKGVFMHRRIVKELFSFIAACPSVFHVTDQMKRMLDGKGYEQLLEGSSWNLHEGGRYYVIRNGSALIAFQIPKKKFVGFQIMASHGDSPCFKIKEQPEMEAEQMYVKLNVEKYGGAILSPWFDRPLSVAGRLIVREDDGLAVKLVSVDRDLVMIPSLAIHMNRKTNEGNAYNLQKDLLPLYGGADAKGTFLRQVSEAAGVREEAILGKDLFLYDRGKGSVWGAEQEFISIGKLDDLQCVFASLKAFLLAEPGESIPVHCVFDNEEVGSGTKQGAASTFLYDTLNRINEGMGRTAQEYRQAVASSFMVSADNAHAVHPNYPEKACPTNRPVLNGGIVIKYSANQKYTTDGVAAALFQEICDHAGVPCQTFCNRSDIPGGSTLGNLSGMQVAVNCVDIGLPQLSMHSPYETAGIRDTWYLVQAAKAFFECSVAESGYGRIALRFEGI